MKKYFTNPSKYHLAIISAFIGLTCAISAAAEEYKSMIRYDRVWECTYFNDSICGGVNKCMKFDGTEEINGKTYHRLISFKKAYPIYNAKGNKVVSYRIEDCHEHEGYMREEDGKVYTLFVPYDTSNRDSFVGRLFIPTSENSADRSKCEEHLLYDMTLNEDDLYTAMSFVTRAAELETFKVIDVSSIEIGGEVLKVLKVGWLYGYGYEEPTCMGEHPIVEGVGAIDYGCLNHYEFSDHLTQIWFWNYFLRLYDIDGNLLYDNNHTSTHVRPEWGFFITRVEEINTPVSNSPIFDILGRRITEPAPGQLYIQNGKKHIAK